MKNTLLSLTAVSALAFALVGTSQTALGQTSVQTIDTNQGSVQSTTTTSAGTISEFSPQTIVVKSENSVEPVRYTYSKSTTYVDESGNPVSIETVKSGLPVTVYYTQEGNDLVASKVIVRKTTEVVPAAPVQAPPPAISVQESKTTTTTTTNGQ